MKPSASNQLMVDPPRVMCHHKDITRRDSRKRHRRGRIQVMEFMELVRDNPLAVVIAGLAALWTMYRNMEEGGA